MSPVLQIGPLALPWSLLLVFLAAGLAIYLGKRMGRRADLDVEPLLLRVALAAVIGARLGFVWEFRSDYAQAPWGIVDLRDGGWSPAAGLVTGWLWALIALRGRPAWRRPVLGAIGLASGVWVAGSLALALTLTPAAQLPLRALETPDGGNLRLADFSGRPTVVNLWASWCPPCVREMPVLQQAQAARADVDFVFLNQGESAAQVRDFLQRHGLVLRNVALDPQSAIGHELGQRMLPTTLFFDARGELIDSRLGELSQATLVQRLQRIAKATP